MRRGKSTGDTGMTGTSRRLARLIAELVGGRVGSPNRWGSAAGTREIERGKEW